MLKRLRVERFKSLVKLDLELGRFNLFIGANGSGKSNILEAVGLLGAAASGRVDDESLLRRGVRPGVPQLYKSAFQLGKGVPHILLEAQSDEKAAYLATLWSPNDQGPNPPWRYKTESIRSSRSKLSLRGTRSKGRWNQEVGVAAHKSAEWKSGDPRVKLLSELRDFAIYCPNTPSLRGTVADPTSRAPMGLSGGRLAEAVGELAQHLSDKKYPGRRAQQDEVRALITWAKDFSSAPSTDVPLSPSAARTRFVVQFTDRFMKAGRNRLTGYDASEGALYVLATAVLALHPSAPRSLAIDNFDQALNPVLARKLTTSACKWINGSNNRQWFVTSHNPAVLDGLPLQDDGVRLFAVDRNNKGHTVVKPWTAPELLKLRVDPAWTLSRMWLNGFLGAVPDV